MQKIFKIVFLPFGIVAGLIAGALGRKAFDGVWRLVDEEEAPKPKQRDISWPKLVAGLVIQGAIFRAVKGSVDHAMRAGFQRATGSWPGETGPRAA